MAEKQVAQSASHSSTKHTQSPRKPRSLMARIMRAFLLLLSMAASLALLCSGYAGMISPLKHGGIWGVVQLAFPLVAIVAFALLVLQLFWHRRGALIIAAAMTATAGPLLTYFPLNLRFSPQTPQEGNEVLKIMTYNTSNFIFGKRDGKDNSLMEYILASDADIVCLQEVRYLGASSYTGVTAAQIMELNKIYKYIYHNNDSQAILSKYPLEPIHLDHSFRGIGSSEIQACRISVGGKLITLFNVHLQSFSLKDNEKERYQNLIELQSADWRYCISNLRTKLPKANVLRAQQVQQLLRYVRHYGGPNVIVCGDFNDVPCSYALRSLDEVGLKSIYPQTGFGPIYTFNTFRMYYCIDHILCRGELRPLTITKGSLKASDHYPLTTTIEILK